jgi:hypothetical protein
VGFKLWKVKEVEGKVNVLGNMHARGGHRFIALID